MRLLVTFEPMMDTRVVWAKIRSFAADNNPPCGLALTDTIRYYQG